MFTIYSAAVKHFVLLLLLTVLPLQISWAAGVAHCPHEGDDGVHASAAGDAAHAHAHVHDTDDVDEGHAAGPGNDCSAFQLVALEPPAAPAQSLSRAGGTAPAVACLGYTSHIPDGLERPKWGLAV